LIKPCSVVFLLSLFVTSVASALDVNQVNGYIVTGVDTTLDGSTLSMISILNNEKTHTLLLTCAMPTAEVIVMLLAINELSNFPDTTIVTTNVRLDGEKTLNVIWANNMVNILLRNYSPATVNNDGFINGLLHSKKIYIGLPGNILYFDFSVANVHINRTLSKCRGDIK